MDITNRIIIELTEYGLTGEVVMTPPSPRRDAWVKNQSMKHARIDPKTGRPEVGSADIGDIEIIQMLAFVKSAPFAVDKLESYYDYCDKIDEDHPGMSMKLHNALMDSFRKLNAGETSPLE